MSEELRDRLIDAAGQAFAERGFAGASVRDICRAAGASVAAINYHFGDKQSLYVACLERAQCSETALILSGATGTAAPVARLHGFIRGMLAAQADPRRPAWHMGLMLREMAHPSHAATAVLERYIRPLADTLREILEGVAPGVSQGAHAGWPIGFSIVGQVLFYSVHGPVVRLLMGEAEAAALDLDHLADHITRFSLAALGHGPAVAGTTAPQATGAGAAP